MRIRIHLAAGPKVQKKEGKNRHVAIGAAALLTPLAVIAGILGLWRICADIGLTGEFGIRQGLFSHWEVWIALAFLLQGGAFLLNRYGVRRNIS